MPGTHRFASKAQWRWAFGTHQPWARRHAEATEVSRGGYKALPTRKGRPSARTLLKGR